jgi:hypothetical protein
VATEAQLATARSLRIDRVTAEVVTAFGEAGIPVLALKGAAFARMLYDDGALRGYGDSDLLVPPDRVPDATAVLERLGFASLVEQADVPSRVSLGHGSHWRRAADYLDLHWTLPGAEGAADEAWSVLARRTERLRVGGAEVEVPAGEGLALLVALHAGSHSSAWEKPIADLARALERVPREDWMKAAELARSLDALAPFAAGLRMHERGRALAEELRLPRGGSVHLAIKAAGAPGTAHGIEALASAPGLRARARMLGRALVPPRPYMHVWFPRAGRGGAWLALSYLWRPFWLARRAPASLSAWRRARREARGG